MLTHFDRYANLRHFNKAIELLELLSREHKEFFSFIRDKDELEKYVALWCPF